MKRSIGWLECPMVKRSKARGVMSSHYLIGGRCGRELSPWAWANMPVRRRGTGQRGRKAMRFAVMAAALVFGLAGAAGAAGAAEYMEKTDFQKSRAFSPGVITQGGRIVWMAGQTATRDEAGNDISGN